jgi:AraC-like DNA-binding protein
LRPYISRYLIQETGNAGSNRILPDTSLVMGFQFSGSVAWKNGSAIEPLSTAGITGILHRAREFSNAPSTGTILVYFKPGGAAPFLSLPLQELQDQSVSLYDLLPNASLRETAERMILAPAHEQRITELERLLLSVLREDRTDPLAAEALSRIIHSGGSRRIKEIATELSISQRQLERRFRVIAGASPKQFASLVRFRQALKRHPQNASLTALGYDAGYFDQAHFIREFRSFTGLPPLAFFRTQETGQEEFPGDSAK